MKLLFMGIVLVLLFLPQLAVADLGPKPTVNITLTYEGTAIQEPVFGKLMECYPLPMRMTLNMKRGLLREKIKRLTIRRLLKLSP